MKINNISRVFITSDTHFGHKNICSATTEWAIDQRQLANGNVIGTRDFGSLEEMNAQLVRNINLMVPEDGILIHLGDWSFGGEQNIAKFREQLNVREIHLITGNHDCFDNETEFLTDKGWLKFDDIDQYTKLASMNTMTHNISFNLPVARHSSEYNGDMFKIKGIRTDLLITPNHKLYYNLASYPQTKQLKEISKISLTKTHIGMWNAGNNMQEDYDISDDLIRIAAWIITDGSVKIKPKGINYILYQNEKKVQIIKDILNRLSINYREEIRQRNITSICGRKLKNISKPSHTIYIKQNTILTNYITSKYIFPNWVYKLSKRQFDIFLENFILGDGTKHKQNPNTSWMAYGKKQVLDQLQHLCVCNGHKTSLRNYRNAQWVLNINVNNSYFHLNHLSKCVEIVPYEGKVYCFQTVDGTLIVRRNGKVSITGNSHIEKGKYDHLFASRQKYLELEVDGMGFCLFHFPILSWNNIKRGWYQLHGHMHWQGDNRFGNGRQMDVGVDGNNLYPYPLQQCVNLLQDRRYQNDIDHHA